MPFQKSDWNMKTEVCILAPDAELNNKLFHIKAQR